MSRAAAQAIGHAYCVNKFPYDYPPGQEEQRARHINGDTDSTADQIIAGQYPWLVAVFDLGYAAGALATPSADVVQQLRDAHDPVSWARNSGDGTVPTGQVDTLLDAANALLQALPPQPCDVCGQAGERPVRRLPDQSSPIRQVCVDTTACCQSLE